MKLKLQQTFKYSSINDIGLEMKPLLSQPLHLYIWIYYSYMYCMYYVFNTSQNVLWGQTIGAHFTLPGLGAAAIALFPLGIR